MNKQVQSTPLHARMYWHDLHYLTTTVLQLHLTGLEHAALFPQFQFQSSMEKYCLLKIDLAKKLMKGET